MKLFVIILAYSALLPVIAADFYERQRAHGHAHERRDRAPVIVHTTIITTARSGATGDTKTKEAEAGTAAGSKRLGYGFSYAPFKTDRTCKNVDEIKKDFATIGKEFSLVRIYGTGCNQVESVLEAAQERNFKIFAGIWDIKNVEEEAKAIVSAAKNDWTRFPYISVGNELVNSAPDEEKAEMALKVVDAISKAKSILRKAGYRGKITTVDTLVAARKYPAICAAGDACTVNCHPFFDGTVTAAGAGKFVSEQVATLANVIAPGQEIIVTETGWPWKGNTNNAAVPSLSNQAAALDSIKSAFKSNKAGVVLFSMFNDHWKTSASGQFGAEQFWGLNGLNAPSG